MNLFSYEHKIVRVIDVDGHAFTGVPISFPADYGFHEFNRDEESIKIGDYQLFESDIHDYKGRVNSMTFMELANNRYSERYFDPRPVEQEKTDKILAAGRTAPTACNYQPQRIYVIQSEEGLKKVRGIRVSHFNAPLMMLVCYDVETAWRNPGDQCYENYCSGEQDAAIVAATMMYEAEELGVHSVWLRGFDSQQVAEVFNLPKNHIPVMMFAMGYSSEKTKPSPWHFQRKPIEETVIVL